MTASPTAAPPNFSALPEPLRRLVVRQGVGLGLLAADDRALALGWVSTGLPADRVMNEREVNTGLKARRDGPAARLATERDALRQRWQQPGQTSGAA